MRGRSEDAVVVSVRINGTTIDSLTERLSPGSTYEVRLDGVPVVAEINGQPVTLIYRGRVYPVGKEVER